MSEEAPHQRGFFFRLLDWLERVLKRKGRFFRFVFARLTPTENNYWELYYGSGDENTLDKVPPIVVEYKPRPDISRLEEEIPSRSSPPDDDKDDALPWK